ncbi:E3 ubiquitin-protein ligase RNF14-like [Mytilus galloprovincialis]|uniref:E3 ubiquitin-protein ligase RNF14-like n=1 Tax=Mytilus galloprovincialis TaxID=29158 RepID=UPI003F7B6BF8
MTDKEQQEDELLALTSIYDETVLSVSDDTEEPGGQFLVSSHIPENFSIKSLSKDNKIEEHVVKNLPPISLNFQLPKDYPSVTPPQFTLSCKWLNRKQLTKLCLRLDEIWEEYKPCVVVFLWTSFLQDESYEFLGLSDTLDLTTPQSIERKQSTEKYDPRAIQDIASQNRLLATLIDYDKQVKQIEFDRSLFECKVCFCDRTGSQCINFYECDHVYCKECMKEYFTVQIGEGNVNGLYCPEDKCESQAHQSQVKELVPPELYAKYDKLLLQTGLDTMLDIAYCPRPSCQQPVIMDKEMSMASCASCCFVFCTLCKLSYHGLSPCRIKAEGLRKLKDEWLDGDEATRKLLEKKYGKAAIQQAVEESFSNEWLDSFAKKCPHCGAQIQKIDGCNKMTCMKCRAHFCWICNGFLAKANPYSHFSEMGSKCFNRLFEGVDMGDDDDDWDQWI